LKFDIAHIHEESEFIITVRALNPNIKIVLHMHCEWLTQLDHKMIECRLNKTDLILSCSQYITDKTRKNFPSVAKSCHTLYNGVDLAIYGIESKKNHEPLEPKQLLYVSRVTPEKGIHVLIDAFKEVVTRNTRVRLEIMGPLKVWGPGNVIWLSDDKKVQKLEHYSGKGSKTFLDHLKQELVSLKIADKVTFHGRIPNKRKIELYKSSDILIQPSIFQEPFGMAIIEAMACQLPVVASRVGGIPEIIEDGKTGLLVEAGDSRALANAILELLSHEDLRRRMGESGRKQVESFSWENITKKLLHHYNDLTNHARDQGE
jgi:spore coat protein SA